METEKKDFLDDVETPHIKPKKQLSEQKLKHLETIRIKALEKKREMKAIIKNANKSKEIESLKRAKNMKKNNLQNNMMK